MSYWWLKVDVQNETVSNGSQMTDHFDWWPSRFECKSKWLLWFRIIHLDAKVRFKLYSYKIYKVWILKFELGHQNLHRKWARNRKHEVPCLSKSLKFLNLKFPNFNALLRKYCFLYLKSDWFIWKRASRSSPLGIMKVY